MSDGSRLRVEDTIFRPGILKGEVAIVTGGGTGIGKAIASEFALHGAKLVLASRDPEHLASGAKEIRERGAEVHTVAMDIRKPEDCERAVRETIDRFGRLDILVNNAAGNFIVRAEDLSVNGWNAVVNIVLNGTYLMTQAAGKVMRSSGRGGRIVNIVATYAWGAAPMTVHSGAAKAGVLSLTRTLAIEWAKHGIRVNAVAPGPIEGTGAAKLWPGEVKEAVVGSVPVKRMGEAREIAWAALYLCSPAATYVNGECLTVDGGQWLNNTMFGNLQLW